MCYTHTTTYSQCNHARTIGVACNDASCETLEPFLTRYSWMTFCEECFLLPDPRTASGPRGDGQAPLNHSPQFPNFTFGARERATTAQLWHRAREHPALSPENLSVFIDDEPQLDPAKTARFWDGARGRLAAVENPGKLSSVFLVDIEDDEIMLYPVKRTLYGIQRHLISDFWSRLDTPCPPTHAERALVLQLLRAIELDDFKISIQEARARREEAERHRAVYGDVALFTSPLDIEDLAARNRECSICRVEFGVAEEGAESELPVRLHGCQHVFGKACLTSWVQDAGTCPLCRQDVAAPTRTSLPVPAGDVADQPDEEVEDILGGLTLERFAPGGDGSDAALQPPMPLREFLGRFAHDDVETPTPEREPAHASQAGPADAASPGLGEASHEDEEQEREDEDEDEDDGVEDLPSMPLWMRTLLDTRTKRDLEFLFMGLKLDVIKFMFEVKYRPVVRVQPGQTRNELCPIQESSFRFM